MRKTLLSLMLIIFSVAIAFAQTVSGRVVDGETGEGLPGATVMIKGTTDGTVTDTDGTFSLEVNSLNVELEVSYVGFQTLTMAATADMGRISLDPASVGLEEVMVVASFAVDRKTPVAVSTIKGKQIEERVGNQEFPEVLRYTPSIYATKQGGGFGDARINVRGFDQRNTAVMINGIPVNDMENGWVYWSNWAGLSDVSSAIQVQRGLSASKLAVSSVGGTINIVTKAAELKKGGAASLSFGNDAYQKYGLTLNSGLLDNGWAFSFQGTRTQGDGYVDGTQFSAWSYFASISKNLGDRHTVVLTGLGAPQWHHQRTSERFYPISLQTYRDNGIKYNELWGTMDGDEFSWRRNFYHKPKLFLNHYFDISDKSSLNTSVYFSLGNGGGTGPRGRGNAQPNDSTTVREFDSSPVWRNADGTVRWDDIVSWQQGNLDMTTTWGDVRTDPSFGRYTTSSGTGFIRRASMNYHTWTGILSTFNTDLTDNLNLNVGFDGRYYLGEHFRRVENLLGLDAYESRANNNNPSNFITTTDAAEFGTFRTDSYKNGNNVLNYWNDGIVTWYGIFSQLEYSTQTLSAFVALSGSSQGYKRVDYFNYAPNDTESNDIDNDGEYRESPTHNMLGGTIKAGANYNIDNRQNVFAYGGVLSRQPLFDGVWVNFRNQLNEDVGNETIYSFEIGYGYTTQFFNAKVNLYNTLWTDRTLDVTANVGPNQQTILFVYNIGELHQGLELEMSAQPVNRLEVRGMVSLGNWRYTEDFQANGTNTDSLQDRTNYTATLALKDAQVGDAAQTTFSLGSSYEIFSGFKLRADFIYYDKLYAQWDVLDDLSTGIQQLPSYSLVDLGFTYNAYTGDNFRIQVRGNVNNLFDTTYISEMYTNVPDDPSTEENEFYTRNRGFYGFGRTWNAGIKVSF